MLILWNWLGLHLGRVFTLVVGSDVLYILTRPLYNHADFSNFVLLVTEKVMLKSQAMLMDLSVLFDSVATSCIWGVCEQLIQTCIFIMYCGQTFYHYHQKEKYFFLLPVFLCVCMRVCMCVCLMYVYLCVYMCLWKPESKAGFPPPPISILSGGQGLSLNLELLNSSGLAGQWVQGTQKHENILM